VRLMPPRQLTTCIEGTPSRGTPPPSSARFPRRRAWRGVTRRGVALMLPPLPPRGEAGGSKKLAHCSS